MKSKLILGAGVVIAASALFAGGIAVGAQLEPADVSLTRFDGVVQSVDGDTVCILPSDPAGTDRAGGVVCGPALTQSGVQVTAGQRVRVEWLEGTTRDDAAVEMISVTPWR